MTAFAGVLLVIPVLFIVGGIVGLVASAFASALGADAFGVGMIGVAAGSLFSVFAAPCFLIYIVVRWMRKNADKSVFEKVSRISREKPNTPD